MDISLKLRQLGKRVIYPNKYSSDAYVKYLRKLGCQIGEHTHFFGPLHTTVDVTRPYLISIGNYCKISNGVTILTHDFSHSVLRMKYKEIIDEAGAVSIGDNVFIGVEAIILKGVKVGSNSIIGAGAVVSHDIPDNAVAAGNPAKAIITIDEYYNKSKEHYIDEAKEYAKILYKKLGRIPTIKEVGFFSIYLKRDLNEIKKNNLSLKYHGDDYEDTVEHFLNSKPVYEGFEEFLKECGIDTN